MTIKEENREMNEYSHVNGTLFAKPEVSPFQLTAQIRQVIGLRDQEARFSYGKVIDWEEDRPMTEPRRATIDLWYENMAGLSCEMAEKVLLAVAPHIETGQTIVAFSDDDAEAPIIYRFRDGRMEKVPGEIVP